MHDFEGWVIFLICGLVLILEVIIMERLTTRIPLREVFTPPVFKSENRAVSSPKTHESIAMMFVAVMSIGAAIVSDRLENRSEMIPTLPELSQYPLWLNGWQGQPSPLSAEVIDALLLNEHIKINYQKDQIPLTFYVAWYASQRKGASPHSPRVCIPGGGWEIADFRRTRVDEMPINRVVIRKGEQKQLVYYWFEERGKPIANEYYKKWALLRDAILMNRTDGALVRISSPIMEHEPIEITEQRLKDFTRDARSRLSELLNDQKSLVL
jgi:EpsI family protein